MQVGFSSIVVAGGGGGDGCGGGGTALVSSGSGGKSNERGAGVALGAGAGSGPVASSSGTAAADADAVSCQRRKCDYLYTTCNSQPSTQEAFCCILHVACGYRQLALEQELHAMQSSTGKP